MRARIALALATVYVVWGSTYLGMAVAIRSLPPFLMSSIRFLLAGGILYAWTRRLGRPTRAEVAAAAISGGALLVVGNAGIAWAEQRVDTGVAALLVGAMPLWLALQDRAVFRRSLTLQQGLGGGLRRGGGDVLQRALAAARRASARREPPDARRRCRPRRARGRGRRA